jgi:hypothetical protein
MRFQKAKEPSIQGRGMGDGRWERSAHLTLLVLRTPYPVPRRYFIEA